MIRTDLQPDTMAPHRARRNKSHKKSRSSRPKPLTKVDANERVPRPYGPSSRAEDNHPKQAAKVHRTLGKDLPFLQKMGYDGRELTLAIRKNAEKSMFSRLTTQQLTLLVDLTEDSLTESSLLRFLNQFMIIIDNAFFFGTIRPILHGFVIYSEKTSKTEFYRDRDSTIHINRTFFARNGDYPQRRYLETLAHEMLHAFLNHYTCQCKKCSQKVGSAGILGASGHGPIWANAMIAIQNAMSRDLKWEVDCNIEASVMNEMKASGWKPRHEQTVRWGCKNLAEKEHATPSRPPPGKSDLKEDLSKASRDAGCCAVM